MICKKCGALNPDDARFCKHCGDNLSAQASKAAAMPDGGQRAPNVPPRSFWNRDMIIAHALWVAAFAIFFYATEKLPSSAQVSACRLRVGSADSYLCNLPDPLKYLFTLALILAVVGFRFLFSSRKR
jgi:hypothetical protein